MKKSVFITARTNSTRLKNKALIELENGLTTLEYLIKRIKRCNNADDIVLCTTRDCSDDRLVEIAIKNKIKFFRGSTLDKLDRWLNAAKKFNADYIITADGDDLFCQPKLIDLAFDQFSKSNADFIQATNLICGAFTYGIKTSALDKVCKIKDSDSTEMMWVYFTKTGIFDVKELQGIPKKYYRDDIRMTLDYQEDLNFFNEVLKLKGKNNLHINLDEILSIIDKNPAIKEINFFRQNEFLKNQELKTDFKIKNIVQ